MKLAVKLVFSLALLALFTWLLWPDGDTQRELDAAIQRLRFSEFWPYLAAYLGLMGLTHLFRSLRWNYLLAPLGVRIPNGRLLAISSVGFMAILALPVRLGEFVRPALIRKKGHISASAALGTVAVERIVDGLLISLFVFGCFFAIRGPSSPWWMMLTAYGALGIFAAAAIFLVFALRAPEPTVRFALRVSLIERISPRLARTLEVKLLEMVRGFAVLEDPGNLIRFGLWSTGYWLINGLSVWVLARGFGMDLSLLGAYATMGLVAVGITLPNAPGNLGQYQWFTMLGLSLYLGPAALEKGTPLYGLVLAYSIVLYLLQVVWYMGMGAVALATPYVSLHEAWQARKLDGGDEGGDDAVTEGLGSGGSAQP